MLYISFLTPPGLRNSPHSKPDTILHTMTSDKPEHLTGVGTLQFFRCFCCFLFEKLFDLFSFLILLFLDVLACSVCKPAMRKKKFFPSLPQPLSFPSTLSFSFASSRRTRCHTTSAAGETKRPTKPINFSRDTQYAGLLFAEMDMWWGAFARRQLLNNR